MGGEAVEILYTPIEDENGGADASAYYFAFEGRKTENGQTAFRAELRLYV